MTAPSGSAAAPLSRNLLDRVPSQLQDLARSLIRSIFNHQLPAKEVHATHARVVDQLAQAGLHDAADMLADAADDILAFTAYPQAAWRRVWSNNPISVSPDLSGAGGGGLHGKCPPRRLDAFCEGISIYA